MNRMRTAAGLWIDPRMAVIAIVAAGEEKTMEIRSYVERRPGRFAGVRSTDPCGEQRERADGGHDMKFMGYLNQYYEEVIEAVRNAESILLFGPGEAKGELKKRLEHDRLGGHITAVETADEMTGLQVVAKVREYFHEQNSA